MPLFRDAVNTFREVRNATIESPTVPISSQSILEFIGAEQTGAAGMSVTESNSLGISAVYRAVNLIASTAAGLPLHAYSDSDDDDVRLKMPKGSAAQILLRNPHPDMTPFEWKEMIFVHLALWGNAYLRKLRNGLGQVVELWVIHPSRVRSGRDTEVGTKVYVIDGKVDEPLSDNEILHIPGFGYDGVCGVSPIRAARQGLGLAMAAEQFGASLFGSGSLASGILQTEQRLEQKDANALAKRWRDRTAGIKNAHDVVVLDRGAKFQQLSIPPEDAQFIESRKFQVEEVARMYGVPPHMLMQTDKSTSWGAGIEQQSIGFVVFSLSPWLIRVEQRLTKLIRPAAAYAKFNVDGLKRGDSQQRAQFYAQMWQLGVFSTNDIRRLEDLPPVPGGDARYVALNFGELGAPPAPAPATPAPVEQESANA